MKIITEERKVIKMIFIATVGTNESVQREGDQCSQENSTNVKN